MAWRRRERYTNREELREATDVASDLSRIYRDVDRLMTELEASGDEVPTTDAFYRWVVDDSIGHLERGSKCVSKPEKGDS